MLRAPIGFAAALLAGTAAAQQFLYDATALPAQNLWTDGVALADVDGDTDLDILFANGSAYGGTGSQGGDTLCASPEVATLALVTGGTGALALPWSSWDAGLSGLSLFFQYAIDDGAAIHGVALSNCEKADTP